MSMLVIVLAAVAFCACVTESSARRITVIAHRGAHERVPENTMPAILAAAKLGCDYVEIDIRETKDGGFVSFHDGTVDRKTNGSGNVADMTLAEVLSLDAGSHFDPSFAGERIVTVDDAFAALAASGMGAYIDVKDANPDSVAALIRRNGLISNSATYCNPDFLAKITRIDPEVDIQPELPRDLADLPALVRRLSPEVVAISSLERVTREAVDACHAAGALVWVDIMGRDNPEGWQYVIDCGVDGIQTDRPSKLIPWLHEKGLRKNTSTIEVIAHKGAFAEAPELPENSIKAFERGVRIGADWAEFDVHATRDGELYTIHDGTVDRTTTGSGAVADLDSRTLSEFTLSDGSAIPTADETMRTLGGRIGAYLEVKASEPAEIVELLRRHNAMAWTVIYASQDHLTELRRLAPKARLMLNRPPADANGMRRIMDEISPEVFGSSLRDISAEQTAMCHEAGAVVWVNCMAQDNPDGWSRAIDLGADAIETDRPEACLSWLKSQERHR